jgi:hypothetical protein
MLTRISHDLILTGLLILGLLCPARALATVIPTNIYTLAKLAHYAFAGTVDSIVTEKVGNHVVTHIRFRTTRFAVGRAPGESFVLTIAGGRYQGRLYITDGMPSFVIGRRYIVLALDEGRPETEYFPILYEYQGFFEVRSVAGRRDSTIVLDALQRPVVAIKGRHLVFVANGAERTGQSPKVVQVHGGSMAPRDPGEPIFEIVPSALDPGSRVSETAILHAIELMARDSR